MKFRPFVTKELRRSIVESLVFPDQPVAYDGGERLYTCGSLPKSHFAVEVSIPVPNQKESLSVKVEIGRVAIVDFEPLEKYISDESDLFSFEKIEKLETIMGHLISGNYNQAAPKTFVIHEDSERFMSEGMFCTLRLGNGRLLRNIDTVQLPGRGIDRTWSG